MDKQAWFDSCLHPHWRWDADNSVVKCDSLETRDVVCKPNA
ncbi:hypothetical protein RMSM_02386 [Rhodopirellula maiorica SM1]|uniref:Uncharacterized protein n=1 Tax=Rhodopirellula maiorica SM1 TaxID=1265738 RepID=M5RNA2_9BACT|nr:hypothetical protein RMSM_02386 [Rhodopirellula maiorica SM1]